MSSACSKRSLAAGFAGSACLALLLVPANAAPSPGRKAPASGADQAATTFLPDHGKFRISIGGQPVGSEEFDFSASGSNWVARSSTTAHPPGGGDIRATGNLTLAADGTPIRYEWAAQAQKKASGTVDFANGTAKCAAELGASAPLRKDFVFSTPHVAVLDDNIYYQYAILARLYDWKTAGKQTFSIVIPQDMVPGSIAVESLGIQQDGKTEALRVSTPDLEITLYLDPAHRLMRLEVPSSNAVIERE